MEDVVKAELAVFFALFSAGCNVCSASTLLFSFGVSNALDMGINHFFCLFFTLSPHVFSTIIPVFDHPVCTYKRDILSRPDRYTAATVVVAKDCMGYHSP
ncbi:hypothetical protein BZA05DRAFT_93552 [Tricharina praecox]|uniref:uncharacterized protein n=1 Tax=Tricharina praecox TaxID=43433 RepID=UPI0022209A43|nr:uncharacterized protein BZA05DRAFT_93552 [Tricharina praecox]KAI5848276.1 hypothetical protein BZA05DRAFT_93552 [Tricharina praecox]